MTTRTWTSTIADNASDPNAWTPTGAPAAGDTLAMPSPGYMEIDGNVLQGDTLTVGQSYGQSGPRVYNFLLNDATANIQAAPVSNSTLSISVQGADNHLTYAADYPSNTVTTIGLKPGAAITGTISQGFSTLTVSGQPGTFFHEAGDSAIGGATAQFGTDVDGSGNFAIHSAQSVSGHVEFTKSVGSGLHFIVGGDPGHRAQGTLQVDNPAVFNAPLEMGN